MKTKAVLYEWLHSYSIEIIEPFLYELSSTKKEFLSFKKTYFSLVEDMPEIFPYAYNIMLISNFEPTNGVPRVQSNGNNRIGIEIFSDTDVFEPLCLARCIMFLNRSYGEEWTEIRSSLFYRIEEMLSLDSNDIKFEIRL